MRKLEGEGVIREGELYTLNDVRRRLGLTQSGWRALRRKGLPFIPFGKRVYVSGRQVIEYLEEFATNACASESSRGKGAVSRDALDGSPQRPR